MWFLYYFNFERNYDVLKSKNLYFLLNKNINFNKNETESKSFRVFLERRTLCFSSYKNRKSKVKLWWVGTCERKKRKKTFFCIVCFDRNSFLTFVFYFSQYCIEYTYISKNITSYIFELVFKIVESLQCILMSLMIYCLHFFRFDHIYTSKKVSKFKFKISFLYPGVIC